MFNRFSFRKSQSFLELSILAMTLPQHFGVREIALYRYLFKTSHGFRRPNVDFAFLEMRRRTDTVVVTIL